MDTINYKVIFCGHVEISHQFQFQHDTYPKVHLLHEKDKCQLFFIGMLIEIQMQTSHKMQLGAYMLLGLGAFEIGGGSLRRTNYLDWNSLLAIASIKDSASLVMYICKLIITTWLW